MTKSRNFSIYLLKDGYSEKNALKDDHGLGDPVKDAKKLPDGATLYVLDNEPKEPWWKSYWGIKQKLNQTLKGAIVFLPVKGRCFAITFGYTYHKLKDISYEYDFGLKTTLNMLDPEKIKSTDIVQPEKAKRERIQIPTASDLTFFDINQDESIFKRLSGAVKDDYKQILTSITGANNLRINSKLDSSELGDLCKKLLEIYSRDDYKESFPNIQNIAPIKDPDLIATLKDKLISAFNDESNDLVFSIPEIVDYNTPIVFSYKGSKLISEKYQDVYIENYREVLKKSDYKVNDFEVFKKHILNLEDENGNIRESFPINKCILFDCEHEKDHYHFFEGEWYKFEQKYINKLRNFLDPYFVDNKLLIPCNNKREDDYNLNIANKNPDFICLDKKNIAPKGQTAVEPCDLSKIENNLVQLIHIKISTRSSSLSHLFNQGLNSIELLIKEKETRNKLKKMVPNTFHNNIDNGEFSVIYGIISNKNKDNKSNNLPIFSRVSLKRTLETLQLMRIKVSVVFIKDKVNRKK